MTSLNVSGEPSRGPTPAELRRRMHQSPAHSPSTTPKCRIELESLSDHRAQPVTLLNSRAPPVVNPITKPSLQAGPTMKSNRQQCPAWGGRELPHQTRADYRAQPWACLTAEHRQQPYPTQQYLLSAHPTCGGHMAAPPPNLGAGAVSGLAQLKGPITCFAELPRSLSLAGRGRSFPAKATLDPYLKQLTKINSKSI